MRVHEVIDEGLARSLDRFELNAHADAPIVPRHAPLGVDLARRAGHAEAHRDLRARLEWAGGANRDPAATQIERRRGGDGVAEPVLDRNAEHDARTAAAVEAVGKE